MTEGEGRARWDARYAADVESPRAPSRWVLQVAMRIPAGATILDLAGGGGRHAVPLSRAGRRIIVADFVERSVRMALDGGPAAMGVVADLWAMPFAPASVDAILVTNFLERDLFPVLRSLLRRGGYLVYETYTRENAALAEAGLARAPRSDRYMLESGELPRLIAPLQVLDAREGRVEDEAGLRCCASVFARKA